LALPLLLLVRKPRAAPAGAANVAME